MARGRKSALADLISQNLVGDGELLRYKSKQGQLMAIGRAREGGIEVAGSAKLLGYTAFEDTAGSRYHRPAEHTHTTRGRTLQALQLLAVGNVEGGGGGGSGAGGRGGKLAAPAEPAVELLEDENDDLCHVCGLGGDLICCETCPAVYHAACLGLAAAPEGDYHCPHCRCTACGAGGSERVLPTGCQWADCSAFASPDAAREQARPHISADGGGSSGGGVKFEAAATDGSEPMQVDGQSEAAAVTAAVAGEPGTADFGRLIAAATGGFVAGPAPAEAAEAAAAAKAAAAAAPEGAAVACPVTCRWTHLRCLPAELAQQMRQDASQACSFSSQAAADSSACLAAACSAGLLPLGSVAEGARGVGSEGGSSSSSGAQPVPLTLLVVRGAAVAAPGDCRGHAPGYTAEQQQQLRAALSAALHVLHSCYESLPDSRTGVDMLPWLLRGAVLAGGEADFSGVHTALLYAGQVVVGVAVFRTFGELAELPLLAVRPELQQRNGLGTMLLAAVERLLLAAGAKVFLTQAFTTGGWPYNALPPAVESAAAEPRELLQTKWGYSLAPAGAMLAACRHPLVRLPGVLLAYKQLSEDTVLPPPRLPQRLQWGGAAADARQLLRDGLLLGVAPAAAAVSAAGAAAVSAAEPLKAAPGAGRGSGKPGRPPKAAPAAPAPVAANVKQEPQLTAEAIAAAQAAGAAWGASLVQQQQQQQQGMRAMMQQQGGQPLQPQQQQQQLAAYQQMVQAALLQQQAAMQQQQQHSHQPPHQ